MYRVVTLCAARTTTTLLQATVESVVFMCRGFPPSLHCAGQLCRTESLHLSVHPVTTDVLINTIKLTPCVVHHVVSCLFIFTLVFRRHLKIFVEFRGRMTVDGESLSSFDFLMSLEVERIMTKNHRQSFTKCGAGSWGGRLKCEAYSVDHWKWTLRVATQRTVWRSIR
jgi:hypothetical protein